MPVAHDFVDGKISGNILDALSYCSIKQITQMQNSEVLLTYVNDLLPITYKSLRYSSLDAYAEASGFSIRYFLFGSDEPPVSYYTPIDRYVIRALNELSLSQLTVLKQATELFYSDPTMKDNDAYTNPSRRFLAQLKSKKESGLPDAIPDEDLYKYEKDVMVEVRRYKNSRYVPSFLFNSDYWPDLATLIGVSVRWLLGIKDHALFCNESIADDIFDMYTLMQPFNKSSFVGLLSAMTGKENPELDEVFLDRKGF